MDRAKSRADRKALTRKYRETPRPAGVWRVTHRPSERMVIGSSHDAPAMLNRIQAQLRMGAHNDGDLQAAWAAHGAESFDFEILDLLTARDDPAWDVDEELRVLVDLWREKLGLTE